MHEITYSGYGQLRSWLLQDVMQLLKHSNSNFAIAVLVRSKTELVPLFIAGATQTNAVSGGCLCLNWDCEAPRNYVKYTENVKNTHHFQSVLTALCTALPLLSVSMPTLSVSCMCINDDCCKCLHCSSLGTFKILKNMVWPWPEGLECFPHSFHQWNYVTTLSRLSAWQLEHTTVYHYPQLVRQNTLQWNYVTAQNYIVSYPFALQLKHTEWHLLW